MLYVQECLKPEKTQRSDTIWAAEGSKSALLCILAVKPSHVSKTQINPSAFPVWCTYKKMWWGLTVKFQLNLETLIPALKFVIPVVFGMVLCYPTLAMIVALLGRRGASQPRIPHFTAGVGSCTFSCMVSEMVMEKVWWPPHPEFHTIQQTRQSDRLVFNKILQVFTVLFRPAVCSSAWRYEKWFDSDWSPGKPRSDSSAPAERSESESPVPTIDLSVCWHYSMCVYVCACVFPFKHAFLLGFVHLLQLHTRIQDENYCDIQSTPTCSGPVPLSGREWLYLWQVICHSAGGWSGKDIDCKLTGELPTHTQIIPTWSDTQGNNSTSV